MMRCSGWTPSPIGWLIRLRRRARPSRWEGRMTDRPSPRLSPLGPSGRRLVARLRLARAALLWERVWPAAWPALCVLGILAVSALFDVLPRLPGAAHAGVLVLFAIAFAGAV